jgi:hypothetical protein
MGAGDQAHLGGRSPEAVHDTGRPLPLNTLERSECVSIVSASVADP